MGIVNLAYQALDKKVMDLVEKGVKTVNSTTGLKKSELANILYFSTYSSVAIGLYLEGNKGLGITFGCLGGLFSTLTHFSNKMEEDEERQKQIEIYAPETKKRIEQRKENWKSIYKTYAPVLTLIGGALFFSGIKEENIFDLSLGFAGISYGTSFYVQRTSNKFKKQKNIISRSIDDIFDDEKK